MSSSPGCTPTATGLAELVPGARIEELDTPSLLVDLDRMERNIADWQRWMDDHGVRFRVHAKTHKVPEIARMQVAAGACGIICAKPSEAEPFAAAGIEDICIAYPVVGEQKWRRLAALAARGIRITANCDNELAVGQAARAAQRAGVTFHLQIDVDTGLHRGGIPVDDPDAAVELARAIGRAPGVELDGVTTFRFFPLGQGRSLRDEGHREGTLLVGFAEQLRARGIEVREVTAGGSFTAKHVAEVDGITEARAGTYVFYDLMHLGEGSASKEQLALTALCSVVSLRADGGLTVDGGSKTFSGDRGAVRAAPVGATAADPGSQAPDAIARSADGRVRIESLTEEHGMGRGDATVGLGEKLRFFPFHACTCVNLSNELVGARGHQVELVWPVAARGLRS